MARFYLTRGEWRLIAPAVLVLGAALAVYLGYFTPTKRAVRLRTAEADEKAAAALDGRLKPVRDLFARGRKGAKAFAEEALSWSGKWAAVKGMVDDRSHHEFLKEAFARHVFTADEVEAAILSACRGYAADLDGVEAEFLVRLRADLDLPARPAPRAVPGTQAVAGEQKALAERVVGIARTDLGVSAGQLVMSTVASDVAGRAGTRALQAVAAELGIGTSLLASGVGSFVATAGIGTLVAIILDRLLEQIFKLCGYDPHAKVVKEVVDTLDRTEQALLRKAEAAWLIWPEVKAGGLRAEMEKMRAERSRQRQQAVQLMLNGGAK